MQNFPNQSSLHERDDSLTIAIPKFKFLLIFAGYFLGTNLGARGRRYSGVPPRHRSLISSDVFNFQKYLCRLRLQRVPHLFVILFRVLPGAVFKF